MDVRQEIKVKFTRLQKVGLFIGLLSIGVAWLYLYLKWGSIPEKVPTHFGADGMANAWGGKGSLIGILIIETIITVPLILLSLVPQIYNYSVKITKENMERQYNNSRSMIIWMMAEINIMLLFINYKIVSGAIEGSSYLGIWYLPIFLVVLFGTIGFGIYRMYKFK